MSEWVKLPCGHELRRMAVTTKYLDNLMQLHPNQELWNCPISAACPLMKRDDLRKALFGDN